MAKSSNKFVKPKASKKRGIRTQTNKVNTLHLLLQEFIGVGMKLIKHKLD